MAFRGHYEHSLDAKHRLSIPARHRAAFSSGVVLAKDSDACIAAWPPEAHESTVASALAGKNPLGSDFKQIQRFFQWNSFDMPLDASGRVTLPPQLMEHAGMEKEVVVAGVGGLLEGWARERWHEEREGLDARTGEVSESLGDPS